LICEIPAIVGDANELFERTCLPWVPPESSIIFNRRVQIEFFASLQLTSSRNLSKEVNFSAPSTNSPSTYPSSRIRKPTPNRYPVCCPNARPISTVSTCSGGFKGFICPFKRTCLNGMCMPTGTFVVFVGNAQSENGAGDSPNDRGEEVTPLRSLADTSDIRANIAR